MGHPKLTAGVSTFGYEKAKSPAAGRQRGCAVESARQARKRDAACAGMQQVAEGGGIRAGLTEDRGLQRKDSRKARDEKHAAEEERAGQARDAPQTTCSRHRARSTKTAETHAHPSVQGFILPSQEGHRDPSSRSFTAHLLCHEPEAHPQPKDQGTLDTRRSRGKSQTRNDS